MTKAEDKKAKQVGRRAKIVEHYEGGINGSEPSFDASMQLWDMSKRRDAMCGALNYYNAKWTADHRRKVLAKHMHTIHSGKNIDLSLLSDAEIPQTLTAMVMMGVRGYQFSESDLIYISNTFHNLTSICMSRKIQAAEKSQSAVQKSIVDRVDEQLSKYIAAIDGKIDIFIVGGCSGFVSLSSWFAEQNVKALYAKRIAEYYTRDRDNTLAALNKTDPDMVEGYCCFSTVKLRNLHIMYAAIVRDAETWAEGKVKERKPQKKRSKSVESQFKRFKYLDRFPELKLDSVRPEKILGAGNVWLYNTKTRQLSYYQAKNSDGLTVKGTTIQNFNETASGSKKLRKPEKSIPLVMGGQRAAEKAFGLITSKRQDVNGRTNPFTIILRVTL